VNLANAHQSTSIRKNLIQLREQCTEQVRNQLGTPRGAECFLRGPKFFKLRQIVLNYVQHIFQGGEKFLGVFAPCVPSYGPGMEYTDFGHSIDTASALLYFESAVCLCCCKICWVYGEAGETSDMFSFYNVTIFYNYLAVEVVLFTFGVAFVDEICPLCYKLLYLQKKSWW